MTRKRLGNSDLTPDLIKQASAILTSLYPRDLGSEFPFVSNGTRYVAVLERHYHEPGGPLKPWGPHKGVSLFFAEEEPVKPAAKLPKFVLGARSLSRLVGVHPDLVRVVKRAIEVTPIDFSVIEGLRTPERQAQLFAQGKSQTLKSNHLTGRAVDLAPFANGEIKWDWPRFNMLGPAVLKAAADLGIGLRWGGNWKSFPDGPHFELVSA